MVITDPNLRANLETVLMAMSNPAAVDEGSLKNALRNLCWSLGGEASVIDRMPTLLPAVVYVLTLLLLRAR